MVSCCSPSGKEVVTVTGSIFAGKYRIQAAITKAHVRRKLSGLRTCSFAPHPQRSPGLTAFQSAAQREQDTMFRFAAVFTILSPLPLFQLMWPFGFCLPTLLCWLYGGGTTCSTYIVDRMKILMREARQAPPAPTARPQARPLPCSSILQMRRWHRAGESPT